MAENLMRYFANGKRTANNYNERWSTTLVLEDMQNKATMR